MPIPEDSPIKELLTVFWFNSHLLSLDTMRQEYIRLQNQKRDIESQMSSKHTEMQNQSCKVSGLEGKLGEMGVTAEETLECYTSNSCEVLHLLDILEFTKEEN